VITDDTHGFGRSGGFDSYAFTCSTCDESRCLACDVRLVPPPVLLVAMNDTPSAGGSVPDERPLYAQLRDQLADDISAGRLAPGTRLPSERALSASYGWNRLTVRQALGELEGAGLLVRRRGSGTYVPGQLIQKNLRGLASFSEDMRQRGLIPSSRVLKQELTLLDDDRARLLGVERHEAVFVLQRLRLADSVPMALETAVVPASACLGLVDRTDLDTASLYDILERDYGLWPDYAQEVVEAVNAEPDVASILDVPVGAALLLTRRLTFAKDFGAFEYGTSLYCGDKYSLGLTVRRSQKKRAKRSGASP